MQTRMMFHGSCTGIQRMKHLSLAIVDIEDHLRVQSGVLRRYPEHMRDLYMR